MATGILHTCVQATPKLCVRVQRHLAVFASHSYALLCTVLSDALGFFDDGITMSTTRIRVAQGSSVPISRGGPPH
jgi:hypothetical protein